MRIQCWAVFYGAFFFGLSAVAADMGTAIVAVNARNSACIRALRSGFNHDEEAVLGTLKELLSEQVITAQDLTMILDGQNPLAAVTSSQAIEYRPVIDQVIKAIGGDREGLIPMIQNLIDETHRGQVDRVDDEIKTKIQFAQLKFYPIAPGNFMAGSPASEDGHDNYYETLHSVTISHEFWIANFLVTQWQYTTVMGENPSVFKSVDGSMQPNHPVENLCAEQENSFMHKLNELSKRDDPLIYQIIPDHPKGGWYRKPTEEEWEYVARNRGAWKGPYPDGITKDNLERIAWYKKNANESTHPVGELEPILIDGKYPIYDLYGNVWERTIFGYVRGGSWFQDPVALRAAYQWGRIRYLKGENFVGFRLVRTPP